MNERSKPETEANRPSAKDTSTCSPAGTTRWTAPLVEPQQALSATWLRASRGPDEKAEPPVQSSTTTKCHAMPPETDGGAGSCSETTHRPNSAGDKFRLSTSLAAHATNRRGSKTNTCLAPARAAATADAPCPPRTKTCAESDFSCCIAASVSRARAESTLWSEPGPVLARSFAREGSASVSDCARSTLSCAPGPSADHRPGASQNGEPSQRASARSAPSTPLSSAPPFAAAAAASWTRVAMSGLLGERKSSSRNSKRRWCISALHFCKAW
mmetsp:Transcript_43997/g.141053  ORF Transcript_43997/g.141053 Transcript_43997/m.141053 type:complete len:271 (+) Transcript_43997:1765-2577(+)